MDLGFFTDRQEQTSKGDGKITREVTPILVLKLKPSMMIWSMLVQCKGAEDQAETEETVESLNRLGYPELIVRSINEPAMRACRDAVIKDLNQCFGVTVIRQHTILRRLAWRTTPSHLEHVALAWFAGQIISCPTICYAAGTWAPNKDHERMIQSTQRKMLRLIIQTKRKYKKIGKQEIEPKEENEEVGHQCNV